MQISRFHQKMLTFNKDIQPALSSFKEKFMLICLDGEERRKQLKFFINITSIAHKQKKVKSYILKGTPKNVNHC